MNEKYHLNNSDKFYGLWKCYFFLFEGNIYICLLVKSALKAMCLGCIYIFCANLGKWINIRQEVFN